MERVRRILHQNRWLRDGQLVVGGVPLAELAAKYGTPLFVYDADVFDRKLGLLRENLHDVDVFYSVKANPNVQVLRFFVSRGCGLEIASAGEFERARRAGCAPEQILFAGPGKTEEELELTLKGGIGEIHVESFTEIERIGGIGKRLGIRPAVAVRVNPTSEAEGGAMRMGGRPSPFGIDEELLADAIRRMKATEVLEFRGIHLFTGTQILDWTVLAAQYAKALEIAERAGDLAGTPVQTVDFGGGLGVPYFVNEEELDVVRLGEELGARLREIRHRQAFERTRFVIEPGRYLVSDGGIYVARVNDIKVSRGKKYIVVDGGMHHHLAASGNLGQVIKRNFPVAIANRVTEEPRDEVDVVGPLCTPLDVVARGIGLPPAKEGDLLAIFQSGAYARSASPLGFLSREPASEVFVSDGESRLITDGGALGDE